MDRTTLLHLLLSLLLLLSMVNDYSIAHGTQNIINNPLEVLWNTTSYLHTYFFLFKILVSLKFSDKNSLRSYLLLTSVQGLVHFHPTLDLLRTM